MSLPISHLATEKVSLSGGEVEVRGTTAAEAEWIQAVAPDVGAMNHRIIAAGTDTPLAEADAWYERAATVDVKAIVAAVVRLSGLGEDDALPKDSAAPS